MSLRRRARRSYIEVPDSDSDDDFLIPESLNSGQSAGESRLKRLKASSRGAEKNSSTSPRGSDVKKDSIAEHHSPEVSAVIDVDSLHAPNVVEQNQFTGERVRRSERAQKSRIQSPKDEDDDDFNIDEAVNGKDSGSDSDVQIRWRKPKLVHSPFKADPVRHSNEVREISEDGGNRNSADKNSGMKKGAPKYVDDSDESFNVDDGCSDGDDSSSEFEVEPVRKRTAVKNKSLPSSKAVLPKMIGSKSRESPPREMAKEEYPVVKRDDDSDGSFDMEDNVSEDEDCSEFEIDEPEKAKNAKKGTSARRKSAPTKKVLPKAAPGRMSVLKGIQKAAVKGVQSGAGSIGTKRLGARPILKQKLSNVEKTGSGVQGKARPREPLTSSSGPRYRSGLSRKQPIPTRLHSYLTPP